MIIAVTPVEQLPIESFAVSEIQLLLRWHSKFIRMHEIPFDSLRDYLPKHTMRMLGFKLQFTVKTKHVLIRGIISAPDNLEVGPLLHRFLLDNGMPTVPLVGHRFPDRNEHMELVPPFSDTIDLPFECTWTYFKSNEGLRSVDDRDSTIIVPEHETFTSFYTRFSPISPLAEFIQAHDSTPIQAWLTQRIRHSSSEVKETLMFGVPTTNAVLCKPEFETHCGGIITGPSGSGKTTQMLRECLRLALQDSLPTLYLLPVSDRLTVNYFYNSLSIRERDLVAIVFNSRQRDQLKRTKGPAPKLIIVDFALMHGETRAPFGSQNFQRLVVDFACGDATPYWDLRIFPAKSRWFVMPSPHASQNVLDFAKYGTGFVLKFPDHTSNRRMNITAAALFRYASVYLPAPPGTPNSRRSLQLMEVPCRPDFVPLAQIRTTLEHLLDDGSAANLQRMLDLLATLDAGLLLEEKELTNVFEVLQGREAVDAAAAAGLILPWRELPHQSVAVESINDNLCPICQEDWFEPVRNDACPHVFCRGCLEEWTRIHQSCPMCRSAMMVRYTALDLVYPLDAVRRPREVEVIRGQPLTFSKHSLHTRKLRVRALTYAIQNAESYRCILVLTHFTELIDLYTTTAIEALRSSSAQRPVGPAPFVWSIPKKFTRLTSPMMIETSTDRAKVIVSHASNLEFFRNDPRIQKVMMMDNDTGREDLLKFKNAFAHASSKVLLAGNISVDYMLMTTQNPNTPLPHENRQELLNRYATFLQNARLAL